MQSPGLEVKVTINPTTMNVGDAQAAAEGVTAFKVSLGTQSGGPYTAHTGSAPIAGLTPNNGVYAVPMSSIVWDSALSNGVEYFAVVQAENSGGTSGNSPEATFSLVVVPTAPASLSFT